MVCTLPSALLSSVAKLLRTLRFIQFGVDLVALIVVCNAMQRMIRAVASLGEAEVRDIQKEHGKIEVTCDFCNETFVLPEAQVLEAITQNTHA